MSCQDYESCLYKEKENAYFPTDKESLYAEKYYDDQTAEKKCYNENRISLLEGFGCSVSWGKVLKLVIIILLVIFFIVILRDIFTQKQEISLSIDTPSPIQSHKY